MHGVGNQVFKHVEMTIHVFRCHIYSATLSDIFRHAVLMITLFDKRRTRRDIELFAQDIEVDAGERKGLSEQIRKIE